MSKKIEISQRDLTPVQPPPGSDWRQAPRNHTLSPVRVLVVLPTYDEGENIVEVLRRVRAAVSNADVLVVDDSSPDGTADIAKAAGHEMGGVEVLVRPAKAGLGTAYRAGFRHGHEHGYDVMVEMDSDLSHDPASLPALLQAVDAGADLAIGSRYVPGGSVPSQWPAYRRALSRWGNRYAALVLDMPVADATSGFRAYRAEALAALDLDKVRADGYGFQVEMAHRLSRSGRTIVEVPIVFLERKHGRSKMSLKIVAEALVLVTALGVRERIRRARRSMASR